MSADNWGICPKCKQEVTNRAESFRNRLKADYGKVSAEEYEKRHLEAMTTPPKPLEATLREDYEIGTDEDGEFMISYSCSCRLCGFSFEYTHKQQIA